MKNRANISVDIDRPSTWVPYKKSLCGDCTAACCSLPVEVQTADLIEMEVIDAFERDEPPKTLAKKLKKQGIIDHFSYRTAIFTLARMANGDCIYLDQASRRCTIYAKRPRTCRNHPQIGPRSGYCAHNKKSTA